MDTFLNDVFDTFHRDIVAYGTGMSFKLFLLEDARLMYVYATFTLWYDEGVRCNHLLQNL